MKILARFFFFTILSVSGFAQQTITVRVFDIETKKPVKNAEVRIVGSDSLTRTNFLGFFRITAKVNDTIVISNMEYKTFRFKMTDTLSSFQIGMDQEKVFTVVEHQAEFPGGMSKLYYYLSKNLKYPHDARTHEIRGKVLLQFVVEIDGTIRAIEIIKNLSPSCDAEALRLVESFPKWSPGEQNGKKVRSKFVLPLSFPFRE